MGRRKAFPEGKLEQVTTTVNSDFKKEMMQRINEVRKPFFIKEGETESEYIKRIQSESLSRVEQECLKGKNK